MNQAAGVIFTEEAGLGQGIGFLTIEVNDNDQVHYELNYSAEKRTHERFTVYTDTQAINLSQYLSEWDLERLNEAYFDFRTTNAVHTYVNVQLQLCETLDIAV